MYFRKGGDILKIPYSSKETSEEHNASAVRSRWRGGSVRRGPSSPASTQALGAPERRDRVNVVGGEPPQEGVLLWTQLILSGMIVTAMIIYIQSSATGTPLLSAGAGVGGTKRTHTISLCTRYTNVTEMQIGNKIVKSDHQRGYCSTPSSRARGLSCARTLRRRSGRKEYPPHRVVRYGPPASISQWSSTDHR